MSGKIEIGPTGQAVRINGKSAPNPFTNFERFFNGSHRWLWNEFIRNPEAMAEYFNEGRYPFGNYGKDGNQYSGGIVHDVKNLENFYIKLDYAKRALILAWDARYIYEDFYRWFVKFFSSYKHVYEKALPQFYQKNGEGYAPYHDVASWMAKVMASTFVKYGPNAFLTLASSIMKMFSVDNEWMEAIKKYSQKDPEILKFQEIQKLIAQELKISDTLYEEYRNLYYKWLRKYMPKDVLAKGRLELINSFHGFLKAKNYISFNADWGKTLFNQVLNWYYQERPKDIPPKKPLRNSTGLCSTYTDTTVK